MDWCAVRHPGYGARVAEWITVREAAQILDVHMSALPKMVRRGDLTKREQRPVLNRAEVVAYRDARQAAQVAAQKRATVGLRQPDDHHDWLTPDQAAEVMGVSPVALNARARRGRIPSVVFKRRRWYRRDHLELVLRAHAAERFRDL